jgi:hypothetical protein
VLLSVDLGSWTVCLSRSARNCLRIGVRHSRRAELNKKLKEAGEPELV